MSDARTDPRADDQPADGVGEEQARAYMEQLRSAPAEQVVAELLGSALNAAQVKLGRNDARLMIDLAGMMLDHARPYVATELAGEVDNVLGQLRLAQVEAESMPGQQDEHGDLPRQPAPGPTTGAAGQGSAPPGGTDTSAGDAGRSQPASPGSAASKLWIPGRDF